MRYSKNQIGFTIVEMMIALSVFSVTVLLTTAIVTGLSKQQQRAVFTARLNDASREVHAILSDSISYSSNIDIAKVNQATKSDFGWFCADSKRYFWHKQTDATLGSDTGLYVETVGAGCPTTVPVASSATNLLPKEGFVADISITKNGPVYTINTTFNIGSPDMFAISNSSLADPETFCLPALKGGDFCTQVKYQNVVVKKVGG